METLIVLKEVSQAKLNCEVFYPSIITLLTIHGKPPHPSNEWLPQVKDKANGKYFDFEQISTDSNGNVDQKLTLPLRPGDYDVKCFVKDPTDWKTVLYNNLLTFKIR